MYGFLIFNLLIYNHYYNNTVKKLSYIFRNDSKDKGKIKFYVLMFMFFNKRNFKN